MVTSFKLFFFLRVLTPHLAPKIVGIVMDLHHDLVVPEA